MCCSWQLVTVHVLFLSLLLSLLSWLFTNIVAWPTMSCFADWSKSHHITLSIIEWSTFHGRPVVIIHTHTHTHPFNSPLSRTTRVSRYQKGKPIWILLKQETVSGSGISRAICKSASHSRQITMPAPHHSVFTGRMPFLPPNQQHQSTEGTGKL